MPRLQSRQVAVALDMAGCPNRCRHCWLGNAPNRRVPVETLRWVAAQFRAWVRPGERRPFIEKLSVSTWYREPDYAANYRQLWELEKALSDPGAAQRFELLSIWRLARDEGYVRWAREIGTEACQISFFGLESNTGYFTRRPGYFQEALVATERLLEAGIRPRWQLFLTTRGLGELAAFVELIESLRLEERVPALGQEFEVFANLPSPDGEAWRIEPLRPLADALDALPPYLAEKTKAHFGQASLGECLGRAEEDWLPELLACEEPWAPQPQMQAFYVTPELDVYANVGELTPWWRLGNLGAEGVDIIMARFEDDAVPGLRAAFHLPVAELARAYGRPGSRLLYDRQDLIRRWLHQWGEEEGQPTCGWLA